MRLDRVSRFKLVWNRRRHAPVVGRILRPDVDTTIVAIWPKLEVIALAPQPLGSERLTASNGLRPAFLVDRRIVDEPLIEERAVFWQALTCP
ncbi:hypothetical protein [Bradyrhizobium sp. USDA 3315]